MFDVSERTIQKDFDVIKHGLKLPLMRSAGGYYFESTPSLPSVNYTFLEAFSVMLALTSARNVSGIDPATLTNAIKRLETIFPPEFEPYFRGLTKDESTITTTSRTQTLMRLQHACFLRRKVRMTYATASRKGELSNRTVHPYAILPYVRSWHLVAFCEKKKDIRTFKIDRIRKIKMTEAEYVIPEDFNIETYMGDTWGIMNTGSREKEKVVLKFDQTAGTWVCEEFWHKSQKCEELSDGSIIFTLEIVITPEFENWLLYYGRRVEVLKPLHLRTAVAEAHAAAAKVYG